MKHGWLFEDPNPKDWDVRKLLHSVGVVGVNASSQMQFRAPRGYQVTTASCFGWAASRALYQAMRASGYTEPPIPAPRWIYGIARLQEHAGTPPHEQPPLIDVGCYPSYGMYALQQLGFVDEKDFPFSVVNIDVKPAPAVAAKAYIQKGLHYYRIWDAGADRARLAAQAMSTDAGVMIGMRVDSAFQAHRGPGTINSIDLEHSAGHGLTILEIRDDGAARVDNWWQDWGLDDGTGWIAQDVWCHPIVCPDVFAVHGVRLA